MISTLLWWILSSVLSRNAVAECTLRAVERPVLFVMLFEATSLSQCQASHETHGCADSGACFNMMVVPVGVFQRRWIDVQLFPWMLWKPSGLCINVYSSPCKASDGRCLLMELRTGEKGYDGMVLGPLRCMKVRTVARFLHLNFKCITWSGT